MQVDTQGPSHTRSVDQLEVLIPCLVARLANPSLHPVPSGASLAGWSPSLNFYVQRFSEKPSRPERDLRTPLIPFTAPGPVEVTQLLKAWCIIFPLGSLFSPEPTLIGEGSCGTL